jgi:hypothetical protein
VCLESVLVNDSRDGCAVVFELAAETGGLPWATAAASAAMAMAGELWRN